jgi:hypothetical protein
VRSRKLCLLPHYGDTEGIGHIINNWRILGRYIGMREKNHQVEICVDPACSSRCEPSVGVRGLISSLNFAPVATRKSREKVCAVYKRFVVRCVLNNYGIFFFF